MSSVKLSESELVEGAVLTREEFLRRWEASPKIKFAELIRGIVRMPSPLSFTHGEPDFSVTTWLGTYAAATPGTAGCNNTTWFMEGEETPQPDISLLILPEYGGQARFEGGYPVGAPELLTEICASSASYDLHEKLDVYEESRAQEYVAVLVNEREIRWHRLRDGKFETVPLPADGIYRSEVFPGLWLDVSALLTGNCSQLLATVQKGIASPEHAAFVAELAARRKPRAE